MSIEINESGAKNERKMQSGFRFTFLVVLAVALMVINLLAIIGNWRAQQDLAEAESAAAITDELASQRDQFSRFAKSIRRPETRAALAQAISETKPFSALVVKANASWPRDESFYLYSPDDSVSLVVQLDVWKTDKIAGLKRATGTERSEKFELKLNAGQLHQFSFGVGTNSFEVVLDEKEIATVQMPASNSGGGSSFAAQDRLGLIGVPVTLSNRYSDFGKATDSTDWVVLADNTYRRDLPSNKPANSLARPRLVVGIVATLTSTAPKYVAPTRYLPAKKDLNLQWDADSKRYRILSVKAEH